MAPFTTSPGDVGLETIDELNSKKQINYKPVSNDLGRLPTKAHDTPTFRFGRL
jgi:hypothetical protein